MDLKVVIVSASIVLAAAVAAAPTASACGVNVKGSCTGSCTVNLGECRDTGNCHVNLGICGHDKAPPPAEP